MLGVGEGRGSHPGVTQAQGDDPWQLSNHARSLLQPPQKKGYERAGPDPGEHVGLETKE